jgi:hypothetical protein
MNLRLFVMLPAAALALSGVSFCAHSATTPVVEATAAVMACQAARSANEGTLRKRPKAVQNEGTTSVFVSCGLHGNGDTGIGARTNKATVTLTNIGSAPVVVSCTAVDASTGIAAVTKSATIAAGLGYSMTFLATDLNTAGYWYTPAFSCVLPPNAGIKQIWHYFHQEIGA